MSIFHGRETVILASQRARVVKLDDPRRVLGSVCGVVGHLGGDDQKGFLK